MKFPWIRTIAVLEMIGGVFGILFLVYVALVYGITMPLVIAGSFFAAISVLSMLAGSWLWQGLPRGRTASLIIQFVQLPKVVSAPLIFMFSFGFDLFPQIGIVGHQTTWGIQFRFLADNQLFINSQESAFVLGVSIPAIIAIGKLWDYDPVSMIKVEAMEPPGPEVYFSTDSSDS